jgi:hypothetical protein
METKNSTKHRADQRLCRLIKFYENLLESTDTAVAMQAADSLKEILLSENKRKNERAERDLRRAEHEARKTLMSPAPLPVDRDQMVARLQAEIAQRGNA